ncbi:MAG TPA: glycosyltransferase family 4 protein [Anaerolineales bacterium]|nr:glycosyltransferase family 4 protein [Anaerolineales bacterium]
MNLRVIYSNGARIAGGGIGNTSYHAVLGLHRHDMLVRLICGSYNPTEIPADRIRSLGWVSRFFRKLAAFDERNWLDHAYRLLYDHWATRQLTGSDVFHAWSGYCLQTLKQARSRGMVTVLDRAIAHPVSLNELLQAEFAQWGLLYHWPLTAQRITKEIETADYVLIPSDFVRETFTAQGIPAKKLIQVPFGVDTRRFTPAPRREEPFRALFVGQISVRKGVPALLEAWQKLGWQDAELWFAGQRKLNEAFFTPYRAMKGVQFLGHIWDIVRVFQQADVFVFPSIAEGSALVTYEAMACGLPVITTFNAGSVVRDGEEGFIIPIRDAEAVANRLDQLRRDEKLRLRMGAAARARAEKFTWERYGNTLSEALKNDIHG